MAEGGQPPEEASAAAVTRIAERAREFSLRGFKQFFYLTNRAEGRNLPLSEHATKGVQSALNQIQHDDPEKEVIWEWHRESAKTTVATTFGAWLLGHRPDGTIMVFHANETAAKELAEAIAERVAAPIYSLVFPSLKPDPQRGWSLDGYEVVDQSLPYEVWMQEASNRVTPSILGLGLYSAAIRGKRATLLLLSDDVISDDVAVSEKELREAGRRFDEAIKPLATRACLTMIVGTPQAKGDIMDVQKERSVGELTKVPIYNESGLPNWPEQWPLDRCLAREKSVGALSWAKNYLLDLKKASEIPLRYFTFPHDKIESAWVAGAGVDYASQMTATAASPGRSHYALAYIYKRPSGGMVVWDGILGQFSQEDCEFYTAQAQTLFANYRSTVIEAIGKGEEHFNTMVRRPGLKLFPYKAHRRSKPDRLVMEIGPDLQRGTILLSDADTPFLTVARRFADQYPSVTNDDAGWDVWDAIYLARSQFLEVIAEASKSNDPGYANPKQPSPWGALAHSRL